MKSLRRIPIFALVISLMLPPAAFAQTDLPELGDSAGAELSLQTEKKIGQEIMNEIRLREPTYLDDPEVEAYLNQLGGRLVTVSPDPGIGFYFFPLQNPMINAFAMFGGYIGVNTGLILAVQEESELAGVLAHEISHVTQRHLARIIAKQKQISTASLLAMGAALLAARSNANIAGAAITSVSAGAAQAQLGFSRDFEREADRVGFQILEKAGFNVRGMGAFFERLQRLTRAYENNAPSYLRTHPMSTERLSDMQNREIDVPYRQVPDSFEFLLVRARLQAMRESPNDAVTYFQSILRDKKAANLAAAQYGLAVAWVRQKNWEAAEQALVEAREQKEGSPLIERLYAEVRFNRGDAAGGLALYKKAIARFPLSSALAYSYGEALINAGQPAAAQAFLEGRIQDNAQNPRLYQILAKAFAAQGKVVQQHRALAESYLLQGLLPSAIEQLEIAQRSKGGDFYELSAIDARLRQLKQQRLDEMKQK